MSFTHKPSFFVIGAQRAGTTRLCYLLDRHPDIVIPTKEPFYFQSAEAMRTKLDWYRSLFEDAEDALLFGEGSTYYSMCDTYPGTAERIHHFNPKARIIYMVRHPLRRIESAWYQLLSTREISGLKTFKQVVLESDILIEPTLYWRQISAYREFFPDEHIHIGIFDEFVRDEDAVIRSCLRFLGVNQVSLAEAEPTASRNESSAKLQPWPIADRIKGLPGYEAIKRLVPETVRASLGDRMQTPIRAVPRWDLELLDYVFARVEADCKSLLAYLKLPDSLWDLREVRLTETRG
jgi:Sulfotransferase domain